MNALIKQDCGVGFGGEEKVVKFQMNRVWLQTDLQSVYYNLLHDNS